MAITPHIVVRDAERAAAFYREAFGAQEMSRIPTPDGRLMSVQLRIGDGLLHLADEFRSRVSSLRRRSVGRRSCWLSTFPTPRRCSPGPWRQARRCVSRSRRCSGGDLHGQLDDPFGHRWNINQHCATCLTMRSWLQPPAHSPEMGTGPRYPNL